MYLKYIRTQNTCTYVSQIHSNNIYIIISKYIYIYVIHYIIYALDICTVPRMYKKGNQALASVTFQHQSRVVVFRTKQYKAI